MDGLAVGWLPCKLGGGCSASIPSSASDNSPSHDIGLGTEAAVDPFACTGRMLTICVSSVSDSSSSDCSIFGTVMRTAPAVDVVVAAVWDGLLVIALLLANRCDWLG